MMSVLSVPLKNTEYLKFLKIAGQDLYFKLAACPLVYITHVVRNINKHPHLFSSLRPSLI